MNCQVVRACFEDPLRPDFDLRAASAEIADHLTSCGDCSRFVEAQRRLGAGLRLAREAAPAWPASLDAAVLNNYRKREWESSRVAEPVFVRRPRFTLWAWSALGAAALILAMILLIPRGTTRPVAAKPQPTQPPTSQAVNAAPGGVEDITRKAVDTPEGSAGSHSAPAEIAHKSAMAPRVASPDALPASFRGLMYCDALSCGGAMEVIRVQLPASAVALAPSSVSSGNAVFADVLVGPDGIARGIRIVE